MKNHFNKIALVIILISIFAVLINAQSNGYIVYLDGKKVMSEDFEIENSADGLIKINSIIAGSKIQTIAKPNEPKSFQIEQQGAKVLITEFSNGTAKILNPGQPEKSIPSKANVILENNVWSQYILLLASYDSQSLGKQNFNFFLPSLGLEFPLSLEKINSRTISVNNENVPIEDYEVLSEKAGLKIKITADKNKIPLLIEIPAQRVRVVRKDYETQADKLSLNLKKTFNLEFTSEEVIFPNDKINLSGTLTIPKSDKKSFPAAIIATGSGSQERDGSTTANIYKHIAENLTKAGIAVLRVDDRGAGKSLISKEVAETTSYFDLVSDTRAAIDYLSKRTEIDQTKITIVGHSEGVGTALYLAANDKRVAAVALLAGVSMSLDKVVIEQSLYQMAKGETVDVADRQETQIVRFLMKMFADAKLPENANNPKLAWFRDHLNFNPLALTGKVKCPVLILQGERDSQVLAYHAIQLATSLTQAGNKNVSLRILPNLTHSFNSTEDSNISEIMLYELQIWAETVLKP